MKVKVKAEFKINMFALPLLYLLCAAFTVSASFTIDPAVIIFKAGQGEKTVLIELVHTGGGPAAVQLSVFERKVDIDGVVVTDGMVKSSDFLIHPAEIILMPGKRATVQLQYRVKGKVTADRAYTLYSQEVPLDLSSGETEVSMSLKMLTDYFTVVAIDTGKRGKLSFVSSKVLDGGRIELVAENRGAGRVPADEISVMVGGRYVQKFTGNANSIMPGQQRRFTFEYPRAVTAREVTFGN